MKRTFSISTLLLAFCLSLSLSACKGSKCDCPKFGKTVELSRMEHA